MIHVMLDLETLGTGPTAAVVAIGACVFDPHGDADAELPTFFTAVDLTSAIRYGAVDGLTLAWWLRQTDAARQATFQDNAPSLEVALYEFTRWLNEANANGGPNDLAVWGNGATFDNVVIRSAYGAVGQMPPWTFRNDKCYRTVVNLLTKALQPKFVRSGISHHAVDDAVTQARYLQQVYKVLGVPK